MGRRVLLSLVALVCVFEVRSQSSWAEDAQVVVQQVMPDALAALERMGEHLKTLKQFTLSAATTSEDVLDDGEKVMIGGDITYHVKSPDRLRLDIATDKRERHYFYNGKTVTVYAPALKSIPSSRRRTQLPKPSMKPRKPIRSRCRWLISSTSEPRAARQTRATSSRPSTSAIRHQRHGLCALRLPHGDSAFPSLDSQGGRASSLQNCQRYRRRSSAAAIYRRADVENQRDVC